eukprot:TRINITY_DN14066_c0_g1_i1.p1 TRINITY_DN14066_c0_g1~~TRINITY_DN14066_c0_g1_i1.p1  ORF type:complete len:360 (-),score=59.08 TRINITY_DN14066_c0_g1_i1:46-1125(-)
MPKPASASSAPSAIAVAPPRPNTATSIYEETLEQLLPPDFSRKPGDRIARVANALQNAKALPALPLNIDHIDDQLLVLDDRLEDKKYREALGADLRRYPVVHSMRLELIGALIKLGVFDHLTNRWTFAKPAQSALSMLLSPEFWSEGFLAFAYALAVCKQHQEDPVAPNQMALQWKQYTPVNWGDADILWKHLSVYPGVTGIRSMTLASQVVGFDVVEGAIGRQSEEKHEKKQANEEKTKKTNSGKNKNTNAKNKETHSHSSTSSSDVSRPAHPHSWKTTQQHPLVHTGTPQTQTQTESQDQRGSIDMDSTSDDGAADATIASRKPQRHQPINRSAASGGIDAARGRGRGRSRGRGDGL